MKRFALFLPAMLALTACNTDGFGELPSVYVKNNYPSNTTTGSTDTQPVVTPPVIDTSLKTIQAQSVRVIDGDTLEVIPVSGQSERVRLMGIDAPESDQPYGNTSKSSLETCVSLGNVTIEWIKKDQYDRLVGKVLVNSKDCNLEQVKKGMAWHYKQYQSEQTQSDQLTYSNAEVLARGAKVGLWQDSCPIAPWDWRKGIRTGNCGDNGTSPTTPVIVPSEPSTAVCNQYKNATCGSFSSCGQAKQALACGNKQIDGDGDGIPCESICKQRLIWD